MTKRFHICLHITRLINKSSPYFRLLLFAFTFSFQPHGRFAHRHIRVQVYAGVYYIVTCGWFSVEVPRRQTGSNAPSTSANPLYSIAAYNGCLYVYMYKCVCMRVHLYIECLAGLSACVGLRTFLLFHFPNTESVRWIYIRV